MPTAPRFLCHVSGLVAGLAMFIATGCQLPQGSDRLLGGDLTSQIDDSVQLTAQRQTPAYRPMPLQAAPMPEGPVVGGPPYGTMNETCPTACSVPVPRELRKTTLPMYVVEPPDILVIDAIHIVPRPPYHLRTSDVLAIQVQGTLPDTPIAGLYPVELGGLVRLGPQYGSVKVAGLTVEDAEKAIDAQLRRTLKSPLVTASLTDIAAKQQVAGEHLVGPDGTVTIGSYGSVRVVGMTLSEAKQEVERHLSQFLEDPEVSLDVFAYNSKTYYVITQGAGMGDAVYRFPVTGNETVLDAVSQIHGLDQVSSKKIWIARPTDQGPCQVLPVCWDAITAQAAAGTNYQLLPGDRLFIADDPLVAFDNKIAKITAPLERIMGFSLLGVGAATRFSGPVLKGGGNRQGTF